MKTSDFLVVGGGIWGLSTAYHLAARGAGSVRLLERNAELADETTPRAAGLVGQIRGKLEEGQDAIRPRDAEGPGGVLEIDGRRFESVRGLFPRPLHEHVRSAQDGGAADDQ